MRKEGDNSEAPEEEEEETLTFTFLAFTCSVFFLATSYHYSHPRPQTVSGGGVWRRGWIQTEEGRERWRGHYCLIREGKRMTCAKIPRGQRSFDEQSEIKMHERLKAQWLTGQSSSAAQVSMSQEQPYRYLEQSALCVLMCRSHSTGALSKLSHTARHCRAHIPIVKPHCSTDTSQELATAGALAGSHASRAGPCSDDPPTSMLLSRFPATHSRCQAIEKMLQTFPGMRRTDKNSSFSAATCGAPPPPPLRFYHHQLTEKLKRRGEEKDHLSTSETTVPPPPPASPPLHPSAPPSRPPSSGICSANHLQAYTPVWRLCCTLPVNRVKAHLLKPQRRVGALCAAHIHERSSRARTGRRDTSSWMLGSRSPAEEPNLQLSVGEQRADG
ncbi:unnamed protein product [Pleuronectes platessa]|uniref:Uncharacterized protein n=1 Tax=Pleuronectes platessa TaxID=8262 RepID=A0A9N7YXJ4_PLEPL|nr:unnamed protein product [Pleuronectes platessa]